MKKGISTLLMLIIIVPLGVYSQDYWKTYRKSDGLIDSVVVDLAISSEKIYLATPQGFSVFENESFTNYDTSNSDLISQNIKIIRQHNDTVYMVTDSGLTQFIDGTITNYNVDSGLISNEITDIELDSKGDLWIASLSGLGRKQGSSFLNDPTRMIYDIGINSGDSLYANVTNSAIANLGSPITAEMHVNGVWSTLRDTSLKDVIQNAKFINLSNGRLGITSTNSGAYIVDSVFSLRQFKLPEDNIMNNILSSIEVDSDTNYWFSMGSIGNFILKGGLYKFKDGGFSTYANGLPHNDGVITIKHNNGSLYIGTYDGFAIASDTILSYPNTMTIETKDIEATISANGTLFSDIDGVGTNHISGFEFPKGTGKNLIYGSQLWLSSFVSEHRFYLSTVGGSEEHFRSGTINNNKTAISANMIYITKSEISSHLKNFNNSGYTMAESIRSWPANGRVELGEAVDQAPFVDVNNNGCYDPENGDYPAILGDKAIYMVICDDTKEDLSAADSRFGVEAHIMIYVYDIPSVDYINQSTFIRYNLVNRSNKTYNDVKLGFFTDYDVGLPADDAFGCDRSSNTFFAFNSDFDDQGIPDSITYGKYIPFVGTKYMNQNMTGHIGFSLNGTGNNQRPNSIITKRNALDLLWADSLAISENGDGYNNPITTATDYLFPGRLDKTNEWSFINPGFGYNANTATDYVSMGITNFNEWLPNERKIIDVVVGVGLDSANIDNYDNYHVLLDNLDKATRFQQGIDSITPTPSYASCATGIVENSNIKTKSESLNVYPNPANGDLNILATESISQVSIYDLQGKEVFISNPKAALRIHTIQIPEVLKNGLYLIRVITIDGNQLGKQLIIQR